MTLLALVGPTASGKSALALEVAAQLDAEIVSCDSMQVYRGFDIGTAKPSVAEQQAIRHHLIDVAEAGEEFSAARWAELATAALADIAARGKRALITGGTGLYLRALRFGLVAAPPRDEALRRRFSDEEIAEPGVLHKKLALVDPPAAARLPPRDLVRIIRALEVHALTGRSITELHAAHAAERQPLPMHVVVLSPLLSILQARILARAESMVAAGLVDETRVLVAKYGPVTPLDALGYKEARAVLDGGLPLEALVAAIAASTRRYARRQTVWFRKEPGARFVANIADAWQALV
jgi:tRNA dimethylallyltransferase